MSVSNWIYDIVWNGIIRYIYKRHRSSISHYQTIKYVSRKNIASHSVQFSLFSFNKKIARLFNIIYKVFCPHEPRQERKKELKPNLKPRLPPKQIKLEWESTVVPTGGWTCHNDPAFNSDLLLTQSALLCFKLIKLATSVDIGSDIAGDRLTLHTKLSTCHTGISSPSLVNIYLNKMNEEEKI